MHWPTDHLDDYLSKSILAEVSRSWRSHNWLGFQISTFFISRSFVASLHLDDDQEIVGEVLKARIIFIEDSSIECHCLILRLWGGVKYQTKPYCRIIMKLDSKFFNLQSVFSSLSDQHHPSSWTTSAAWMAILKPWLMGSWSREPKVGMMEKWELPYYW